MTAQRYQVLLEGAVDTSWSDYFDGMSLTTDPHGQTRLVGAVADQAALHGLLNRIRDLNLYLVSVQLLDGDGVTPVESRPCRTANRDNESDPVE